MSDIGRAVRIALSLLTVALGCLLVPGAAYAQHETAADLLDGERAFRNTCANCHGPDGDVIAGIDLGRGQFRRPLTDDDLVRIIRTGIPNTAMPASPMTVEQAPKIVAYLRSRGRGGARQRGHRRCGPRQSGLRAARAACARATASADAGARVGPDLTDIGGRRSAAELERALLDPGADVAPGQPHLPRRAEGRHDGDRPAARPRHLHRAAARHAASSCARSSRATCASTASCRSPMPSYRAR